MQVRSGTEFLLGGSQHICAPHPDLQDFDSAGEILKMLLLPRGRLQDSGVNNQRAVKTVAAGLKRLKQLLRSDLYNKLEAEDLVALLYQEVLALYKSHLAQQDALQSPTQILQSRMSSNELGKLPKATPKIQPNMSFLQKGIRGMRRADSKAFTTKTLSVYGDVGLFRPEPHFISKEEMKNWKSALHVFSAAREPLLYASNAGIADIDEKFGAPFLIESLGLKYPNPEKFYRTIYVQSLLTFNVSIGGSVRSVCVPDWLDWDPTPFFYEQVSREYV